jgi:hypothetical protein
MIEASFSRRIGTRLAGYICSHTGAYKFLTQCFYNWEWVIESGTACGSAINTKRDAMNSEYVNFIFSMDRWQKVLIG